MAGDMTEGGTTGAIVRFSLPMMGGALLQQLYNVVDTLIVSHFIGAGALAAVGSSYTLMVFLTSVVLGLCMGSGVIFSIFFGAREPTPSGAASSTPSSSSRRSPSRSSCSRRAISTAS